MVILHLLHIYHVASHCAELITCILHTYYILHYIHITYSSLVRQLSVSPFNR